MEVTKPAGVFCAQEAERPVRGLVRRQRDHARHVHHQACAGDDARSVRLLYANRDRDSVIFEAALDELATAHPGDSKSGTTSTPTAGS